MTKPVCIICDENINFTSHKLITCLYCSFDACRSCCETYILNESIPKCMNAECNREWSRQFMRDNFTYVFINGKYKKHRAEMLFEQEKALLPSTQPLVENIIRVEKNTIQLNDIQSQINILVKQRRELETENYNLTHNHGNVMRNRSEFVRACPDEECRGYLSTQWKCGICEKWVCPDCHDIKGLLRDTEHICNPDNLATARLLANDTKPCPKCRTGIFKIDGCFSENTPILMWDGSIKMSQYISIGDILVGDDGNQRLVEHTVTGEDELFEVNQDGSEKYIVNSKHKLVLKYSGDKNTIDWNEAIHLYAPLNSDEIEITVDDYLKLHKKYKKSFMGYRIIPTEDCVKTESNIDFVKTNISISPIGRGTYYGWSINENKRFLLKDFTVVRNCDQMWCTQCHTAFNWRSGRIQDVVHNPHYFEWLRRNGNEIPRTPGDVPCNDQQLTHHMYRDISYKLRHKHSLQSEGIIEVIEPLIRNTIHLRYVVMHQTNRQAEYTLKNQNLRIQYMRNIIDHSVFKNLLQINEKKYQKKQEINNIYELIFNTVTSIVLRFNNHLDEAPSGHFSAEILGEVSSIIDYANGCLFEISKTYKSKPLQFSYDVHLL